MILDCLSNSCSDQVDILQKLTSTTDKVQLPVRQPQGQLHDLRNY